MGSKIAGLMSYANIREWLGNLGALEFFGVMTIFGIIVFLCASLMSVAMRGNESHDTDDEEIIYRARLVGPDGKTIQEWEICDDYDYDTTELEATTVQGKSIHILAGPGLAIVMEEK